MIVNGNHAPDFIMKRFLAVKEILLDYLIPPLVDLSLSYAIKEEIATQCSIPDRRMIHKKFAIGPDDCLAVIGSENTSVVFYSKDDVLLKEWECSYAVGLAFHPKRPEIYVISAEGVDAYNLEGKLLRSWRNENSRLYNGIVVHDERIFVSGGGGVNILTTKCKLLKKLEIGVLSSLSILSDELYVTDFIHDCICVFDLEGKLLRSWGRLGSEEGQFNCPDGIAHYNNLIYVADYHNDRIQVFQPDGTLVRSFKGEGSRPINIAISSTGRIYVGYANSRIETFQVDVA
jgi:DNA-binding beta-propeller fold protein YncE